jgi:hypothetical protein
MDFLTLDKKHPFLGKPVITEESHHEPFLSKPIHFALVTYPINNNHCIGTLTFKKTSYPCLSVDLKSKKDGSIFTMKGYRHKEILSELEDYVLFQKKTAQ